MKTELEQRCTRCGDGFWNRVGSRPSQAGALCPKCRTKNPADNKNATNTLVVRQAVRSQGQSDLRDEADVARELQGVLDDGFRSSGNLPKGTFWQLITGTTPARLAEDKRIDSEMAACRLVNREKLALRKLTQVQVARAESEAAIVQSQNAVLKHRVEQARLREQLRRDNPQLLTGSLDEEPEEQVEKTGVAPEKDADAYRAKKKARQAQTSAAIVLAKSRGAQSTVLATVGPNLPALPEFPKEFTDRAALFADIQQLLNEATAAVIPEKASFFQKLFGIDPVAKQLAKKMEAARTADEMVQQRTALFEHLQQMIVAATNAELARLHAHIKLQEAQLRAIELQEQIHQRRGLSGERFQTQQLREHLDQKKLRAAASEGDRDADEIIIDDHRKNIRSRVKAGQVVLSDFLDAVKQVCDSQFPIHEKALRIRKVLDTFEMGEDALPARAHRILQANEVASQ